MPVALRFEGCRFFSFSNEGEPREPAHIHERKGENGAGFRLDQAVTIADSHGTTSSELTRIAQVAAENRDLFLRKRDKYFAD
ncbi:MAG TPA: DUF4160 domain-containing protein [Phycisphaerae bacterium]|nr:DUF4160 domain-containing protein [Phycisphaerae bacterium]HRR85993.1 DUF4160 domain-containing protein [Phycisphaerae bacterium]